MMPTGLEKAASTNVQDKPLTTIPDEMRPAFDYSGLDAQTVDDLHFAEKTYQYGKKLAERGLIHMGDAIAIAHDALCGTVVAQCDNGEDGACRTMRKARNNQHSEDTFKSWCVSIGITKDTAYRLLQVSALLDNSTPRQQKVLKELSPTLLYAVAKPSAPSELVSRVKSGDITTNKQYQEALAQLKAERDRADAAENHEAEAWDMVSKAQSEARAAQDKADAAEAERDKLLGAQNRAAWAESHIQDVEAQRDAAIADVNGLMEQNAQLKKQTDAAEARAKAAEQKLEGSRQVAEAARLRGDKLKAENDALKSQPITAVVDEEEVDRRAGEKAYRMAADMTVELQAQLEQASSGSEQDARIAYDGILLANRAILNTWQIAKPLFRKLPEAQRETLADQIVRTIGSIQGEVTKCL